MDNEIRPYLSVIMGVYNCPDKEMLFRAIDSVLEQDFTDLEFIICDDGSTDETGEWLKEAAEKDSRIVLISNPENMSLAYALNRCIEVARGKYIARQDADDYSMPERFSRQIEYLDTHENFSMVGSDCLLFSNDEVYGRRQMPHHPKRPDFLFNSPFVHGSVMMRRDIFEKAGFYRPRGRERKYEDYDLFMRVYEQEMRGANINLPLYAFYADKKSRKVSRTLRLDEVNVRYSGFKALGLLPKGYIYIMKPLVLAMLPNRLVNHMKGVMKGISGHTSEGYGSTFRNYRRSRSRK